MMGPVEQPKRRPKLRSRLGRSIWKANGEYPLLRNTGMKSKNETTKCARNTGAGTRGTMRCIKSGLTLGELGSVRS